MWPRSQSGRSSIQLSPTDYFLTALIIIGFGHLAIKSEWVANRQRVQLELAQKVAESGFFEWELGSRSAMWSKEFRSLFAVPQNAPASLENGMQIIHPDDRAPVREAVNALLEGRTDAFEVTHRIVWPDAQIKWILSRGKVMPGKRPGARRLVGLAIDITPQKSAANALLKSEKLLAAHRMASVVAHELNNPLQALLGMLFLIRSDAALTPESAERLASAESEIRRLALMLQRSLVSFYYPCSRGEYRLLELIHSDVEIHRQRAQALGIDVDIRVDPDVSVKVNAPQFHQLFSNLIHNAIDSMKGGGGRLSITGYVEKGEVRISVGDSGTGIDAAYRDAIFEPFFSTKGDVGTGLGLWISKNIVESHGGAISVQSDTTPEHHGTVFNFTLPVVSRAAVGV